MSYILDALNKSEQERKSKNTPNLDTVHRALRPGSSPGVSWLTVLVALVILNTLLAIYWFMSRSAPIEEINTQPNEVTEQSTFPENRLPAAPEAAQEVDAEPEPVSTDSVPGQAQLITPDDYFNRNTAPPQDKEPSAVRFAELPLSVQQQVPEIRISSHIYGTDPGFRMANINDQIVREGDMVTDSIRLDEITEDGVILEYLHYKFEMRIQ